jgi:hypothetical protein
MPTEPPQTPDDTSADTPVAYDTQGRPLYAQPQSAPVEEPQVVYMTRPSQPAAHTISPDAQQQHEASSRRYPGLKLSAGEYVISDIRRHPIGIASIWGTIGLAIAAVLFIVVASTQPPVADNIRQIGDLMVLQLTLLLVTVLLFMIGVIAHTIYNGNHLYLTNESVIQTIQTGLFSKREQTVSLGNVEDASYRQKGFLEFALGYGSVRLSTEGAESTYRLRFVDRPQAQIALLNDAVESFKNGRLVSGEGHQTH